VVNPREQGDFGELSALEWLVSCGAKVALPFGHSPDWDLIAELDREVLRVQVKTSRVFRKRRWEVTLCTRGGNQSWNGLVKLLDRSRCDYVFVHVGDGRRWFIPTSALGGGSGILLGGPKYLRYEVEPGRPFVAPVLQSPSPPGGCPSGQRDVAVNHAA
jgi:hypothetical protein